MERDTAVSAAVEVRTSTVTSDNAEAQELFAHLGRPALAAVGVASVTAYASRTTAPVPHVGLPSPRITLVIGLAEPIDVAGGGASVGRFSSCLAGMHTEAAQITMPRRQEGVQLALDPLACRGLLGVPVSALPLFGEDAESVLGRELREVSEQLGAALSHPWPVRVHRQQQIVSRWLLARAQDVQDARADVRPDVAEAWRVIMARRGDCRVRDLARHVHLSERQLRTVMRSTFGMTPKAACRLARFDHVVERLVTGADRTLADTAAACGYADHAHLDAEFTATTGLAPSRWMRQERRNIQAGGHRNRPE
ncbi:MAG: helix-turn-helix domain-containing protein [Dermatophilus congolensis]|nr:helix-turn-helix domain-containing protein [Dermatophilus congolensis]